jgi:hypothetical protein
MLIFGAYPGTPPENVGAVIRAMQKYYVHSGGDYDV